MLKLPILATPLLHARNTVSRVGLEPERPQQPLQLVANTKRTKRMKR